MKTSNRAFTLVELLVVISIIGILIALLLPALQKSRQSAQAIQCGANQRQAVLAVFSYCDDSKDAFPMQGNATNSQGYDLLWAVRVIKLGYVGGLRINTGNQICQRPPEGVMSCPSVRGPFYDGSLVQTTDASWAEGNVWGGSHFMFNGNLNFNYYAAPSQFQRVHKRREVEARRAVNNVVLFADGCNRNINFIGYQTNMIGIFAVNNHHGFNQSYDQRHLKDRANASWLDGHVTLVADTALRGSPDLMPWEWR